MVLIAGPYRSGIGDDPSPTAANERTMHEVALEREHGAAVLTNLDELPELRA
jgi:hypothetical protein